MIKMGVKVKVKFLVRPTYEGDRRVWRRTGPGDLEGWYVGYTFKQEGIYHPMSYSYFETNDGSPAYLSDVKAIKLFRIKLTERSNDSFAFPEDVEVINEN